MNGTQQAGPLVELNGILQKIDVVSRQIEVMTEGTVRLLDVPVSCAVSLNGERVKLRLLQPRDRAQLLCEPRETGWVVRSLRVRSWSRPE
jgi:hypothetical protein